MWVWYYEGCLVWFGDIVCYLYLQMIIMNKMRMFCIVIFVVLVLVSVGFVQVGMDEVLCMSNDVYWMLVLFCLNVMVDEKIMCQGDMIVVGSRIVVVIGGLLLVFVLVIDEGVCNKLLLEECKGFVFVELCVIDKDDDLVGFVGMVCLCDVYEFGLVLCVWYYVVLQQKVFDVVLCVEVLLVDELIVVCQCVSIGVWQIFVFEGFEVLVCVCMQFGI